MEKNYFLGPNVQWLKPMPPSPRMAIVFTLMDAELSGVFEYIKKFGGICRLVPKPGLMCKKTGVRKTKKMGFIGFSQHHGGFGG